MLGARIVLPYSLRDLNESKVTRPLKDNTPRTLKWHGKIAALAISSAGRAMAASLRIHLRHSEELFGPLLAKPVIFAFWHNRLAAVPAMARCILQPRKTQGMTALISASRDGALLSRTLQYFGIQAVRGSSSRRGAQAMLELTTWIEKGYDTAITPDGPRGPKYRVREGAIALAQLTGAPIVPLGIQFSAKKELTSWDAFQLPFPFAQCEVTVGKILRIPANLSEEQREEWRQNLESELKRLDA